MVGWSRVMGPLRRWGPMVLPVACVGAGWGCAALNLDAAANANLALLIILFGWLVHSQRLPVLVRAMCGSPTSLAIAGLLGLVVAFLFGYLSSMGMPGLFWHFRPRTQFVTGMGVTLYSFWMLYLLFMSHHGRLLAHGSVRGDPRSVLEGFRFFGPLVILLLVLPASFPATRAWDPAIGVEWPWLGGVALGAAIAWMVALLKPITWLGSSVARASTSITGAIRSPVGRGGGGQAADTLQPVTNAGHPLLLVTILYAMAYCVQSYAPDMLRPVLPAGVSLCVLLGAVASFLVWLQSRSRAIKWAVGMTFLGLMTITGARDYEVTCRDLDAGPDGFYPGAWEQYGQIIRNVFQGKNATRSARRHDSSTYANIVDLAAYQERLFEPTRLEKAASEASRIRKEWLDNWKRAATEETPGKLPVLVVVCTSGGALRAAVWTEVVLDALSKSLPHFASRVRLITGASGGMLGAARFVVSLDQDDVEGMPALAVNTPPDYLEAIARQIAIHDLVPNMFLPWTTRNRGDVLEDEFARYHRLAGERNRSAPANAESANRPQRGISTTFGELRAAESAGRIPSIVFSPMIAEDGRRLLISNQPLADLATHADTFPLLVEDVGELQTRQQRAVKSQMDLELPTVASTPAIEFFDMFESRGDKVRNRFTLGSAVRMSATFPYVTPSVVLPTDPPRHVVDAGYYDNFGVNLAARWIAANAEWIEQNTAGILLVQIRAFRNERALKLYDPDYQRPAKYDDEATTSVGFTWPSLHLAQVLHNGFGEWFVPLIGAAQAQNRSMYFRNDEQLLSLRRFFSSRSEDFFQTVVFTCDSETSGPVQGGAATLNWYMTDDEFHDIKANMGPLDKTSRRGRDRNDLRLTRLKEWWSRKQPEPK